MSDTTHEVAPPASRPWADRGDGEAQRLMPMAEWVARGKARVALDELAPEMAEAILRFERIEHGDDEQFDAEVVDSTASMCALAEKLKSIGGAS